MITMYLYFSVRMYITTVLSHSDSCLYWCLAYIREGISDLHIYVAVTSPYPRDRGVTHHYTTRRSSCSWINVQSHLFWSPTWKMVQFQFLKWSYGSFQRYSSEVSDLPWRQCLHVVKFGAYSWWITVIIGFKIGSCETIRDYDGFKLRCSVLPRR